MTVKDVFDDLSHTAVVILQRIERSTLREMASSRNHTLGYMSCASLKRKYSSRAGRNLWQ